MKKLIFLVMAGLILTGCGQSAVRSEFWKHDTVYKNWDHMKYSWFGYRTPSAEVQEKSMEQGWWGVDIPYVPGQQTTSE